ncbi:MAG: hypothetical protein PF572_05435 [Patescibacteria group bacterium]|jgi:hypothetical protein|nr:hypothetical protein [Patescibacteria group bacterium]
MKSILFVPTFILLTFLFVQASFAENLQAIFTPTATTAVFLNCYNADKDVVQSYETLKNEMAQVWIEEKNPDTNILFVTGSPFTKQIIYVYVSGIKRSDGSLCALPKSNYIACSYHNKTSQSITNIENPQRTIAEIEKIMK